MTIEFSQQNAILAYLKFSFFKYVSDESASKVATRIILNFEIRHSVCLRRYFYLVQEVVVGSRLSSSLLSCKYVLASVQYYLVSYAITITPPQKKCLHKQNHQESGILSTSAVLCTLLSGGENPHNCQNQTVVIISPFVPT